MAICSFPPLSATIPSPVIGALPNGVISSAAWIYTVIPLPPRVSTSTCRCPIRFLPGTLCTCPLQSVASVTLTSTSQSSTSPLHVCCAPLPPCSLLHPLPRHFRLKYA